MILDLSDSLVKWVLQGWVMRSEGELRDHVGEVEGWELLAILYGMRMTWGVENTYTSDPDAVRSRDTHGHAR